MENRCAPFELFSIFEAHGLRHRRVAAKSAYYLTSFIPEGRWQDSEANFTVLFNAQLRKRGNANIKGRRCLMKIKTSGWFNSLDEISLSFVNSHLEQ
jgi:hypothetical protein